MQTELDNYFKILLNDDVSQGKVSKSALTKARRKFSETAFIEASDFVVQRYYESTPNIERWHGHRLLAGDGSLYYLPPTPDIANTFGRVPNPQIGFYCQAQTNYIYDVLNEFVITAQIGQYKQSEQKQLQLMLKHLKRDDLLLLDMGYPAMWLMCYLIANGIDFCIRVCPEHSWKAVKQLLDSGKDEITVEMKPSADAKKVLKELGVEPKPFKVRVIRVELDNGTIEVLFTSVFDVAATEFKELYHGRWFIEEKIKQLKHRTEIENFSGKTALSVKQDFFAKIFTVNLTCLIASKVKPQIQNDTEHCKHQYQLNWTQILAKMRNCSFLLFITDRANSIIEKLQVAFRKCKEIVRPNRIVARKSGSQKSKKRHSYAYKPIS